MNGSFSTSGRAARRTVDLADLGRRPRPGPEQPVTVAWGPGAGVASCGPVLAALRSAGFACWIGSRREPAGNFEVSFLSEDVEAVRGTILAVAPGAAPLTVGR